MKQILYICIAFCSCQLILGQEQLAVSDSINDNKLDKFYKEDQFYFGISYLLLNELHSDMAQHGFSTGLSIGYIKDVPLNQDRNFGLGIGLGLASNSINHNLKITQSNGNFEYEFLSADEFTRNKMSMQLVEIPIELRWRTSTPDNYKFWRVYAGIKMGYIFASKIKFKGGGESYDYSNIDALEKFNYGLTLSAGYNTWNINIYYGLNPILSENPFVGSEEIKTKTIKIGLIFYLL